MDETTQRNFQRLQGQISAMDTMLLALMRAIPNWRGAASAGATSISSIADALDAAEDENLASVAAGMREYLSNFAGQLDT